MNTAGAPIVESFVGDGSAVLKRTISNTVHNVSDVFTEFDIPDTVAFINRLGAKRVALQFPDELIPHSIPITEALKDNTQGVRFSILADTSYGSCCVDEIAAQHDNADLVIHYGMACLTQYVHE
jgi:diphthamide biosynthesis protein 2